MRAKQTFTSFEQLRNLTLGHDWIKLGWVDAHGCSLSWRYWQEKKHRQAVAYWRDEIGKVTPIHNVLAGNFKLREKKAA